MVAVIFALSRGADEGALRDRSRGLDDSAVARNEGVEPSRAAGAKRARGGLERRDARAEADARSSGAEYGFREGSRPSRAAREGGAKEPATGDRPMPILLDGLRVASDAPVVEIAGFDPEAPRELLAWRIVDGRFAVAARGESDEDGSLHFPRLIAAGGGMEVVVTAADNVPGLPGASEPRHLAARTPVAPQLVVLDAAGEEYSVRIHPSEASGEVLIADSRGVVFGAYEIPPNPVTAARAFDVSLSLFGGDPVILVAHEFSDGRRSDWRAVSLLPSAADFDGPE